MFQCPVNISDGRNPAILEAIRASIGAIPEVRLADLSADPDHHRLVASLLGPAAGLRRAVPELFRIALESIDMSTHEGAHPRIGAVDVVPFVPLWGTPMEAAVELAQQVAREVAERFAVPVFLYEEAARRPDRRRLPDLRRGQLPGLTARLQTEDGKPDFGPDRLHPRLGATVIGARKPLVAYNVVLDSADMELGRSIARALREKESGLAGVRALAVWLASRSRVQISINLTRPEECGLLEVFRFVEKQAAQAGVGIQSSQLIGLSPLAALLEVARDSLKLGDFLTTQVLEQHFRGSSLNS